MLVVFMQPWQPARPSLGCLQLKRQTHTHAQSHAHTHIWAERQTNRRKSNKGSIKMPAQLLKYSELLQEENRAFLCSSVTLGYCSSYCDGQLSVRGMFHTSESKAPQRRLRTTWTGGCLRRNMWQQCSGLPVSSEFFPSTDELL